MPEWVYYIIPMIAPTISLIVSIIVFVKSRH